MYKMMCLKCPSSICPSKIHSQ